MKDDLQLKVAGHVLIRDVSDPDRPKLLLDQQNAIHKGNFIKHLAFNLAGKDNHGIQFMVFGQGNTADSPENVRNEPDRGSAINNAVYGKKINTYGDGKNNITAVRSTANFAEIVATCTLDGTADTAVAESTDTSWDFSELGLLSIDPDEPENLGTSTLPKGILLTHLTFNPITKTVGAGKDVEVVYTVRISG